MEKKNITLHSLLEVLFVSTKLGLTSFGGPIAHLGYFYEEYIRKRKWMDEKSYADLVALCQFLPGPASSQVGIGVGTMRAGVLGGIVAFIGFTLPSAIVLILFALLLQGMDVENAAWLHGLRIVSVAVVAHAIMGMAKKLTTDLKTKTIALFALIAALVWQTAITQVSIILIAGIIGYALYKDKALEDGEKLYFPISRSFSIACLVLFFALLFLLPVIRELSSLEWVAMFDSFYRAGALVFGGGHVVLPLLEVEVVPTGWMTEETFLAGFSATQAMPGPLFTFSAYLGTIVDGVRGGFIGLAAIFLPAMLLIFGALPFWDDIRRNAKIQGALVGVNAAVVGILIAAFYNPIWTNSIFAPIDFAFAALLFSMLAFWKLPPWVIVLAGAAGGVLLTFI